MSPELLGWQSGHVSDQPAPYVPLRRRRSWRSSIAHRSLDAVECGVEVGPASSARLIGGLVRDYSTAIPNRGLTALACASSGRRLVIFELCLTVLRVASSSSSPPEPSIAGKRVQIRRRQSRIHRFRRQCRRNTSEHPWRARTRHRSDEFGCSRTSNRA